MSANPKSHPDDTDQPILSLIQQIKAGQVAPTSLSAEQRRRCVEVLRGEGYSIAEIAQILVRNEKTIRRDIEQIRDELALMPDAKQAQRIVGDMVHHAEVSIARLRRIAREPSATALERATAEGMAWKVSRDCTQLLQSLGYLPRSPVGIVASIHHGSSAGPVEVGDDMLEELELLDQIAVESAIGDSPEAQRCRATLEVLRRRRNSSEVKTIDAKIERQEAESHETPENSPTDEPPPDAAPEEP